MHSSRSDSSGYESERSYDRSSRTASRDGDDGADAYVGITLPNPHWNAATLSRDADGRPRRYCLYGNKAHDMLASGRHEGGGTLGHALGYLEPLAAYMHSLLAHWAALVEAVESGDLASQYDLFSALVMGRNSQRECYLLVNQFRYLVVNKARSLRPGASDYDKAEAKFIERSFDEKDLASADTPADAADLKAAFAAQSQKALLSDLAKKSARSGGSGGGGFGGSGSGSGGGSGGSGGGGGSGSRSGGGKPSRSRGGSSRGRDGRRDRSPRDRSPRDRRDGGASSSGAGTSRSHGHGRADGRARDGSADGARRSAKSDGKRPAKSGGGSGGGDGRGARQSGRGGGKGSGGISFREPPARKRSPSPRSDSGISSH